MPPSSISGTHTDTQGKAATINIPDHPGRVETPTFRKAKAIAQKILATMKDAPYGPGPWQMHHAGSIYLLDDSGWFMALNTLGGEWSAQWCGDPARYDALRQNAVRLTRAFPKTLPALIAFGYTEAEAILTEPITDAAGVARYTDALWNSCVPLAAAVHVGQNPSQTQQAGWHSFPKSIWDIQFTKLANFTLFVTDPQGKAHAVVPVAPPGSGDGRVRVTYSAPETGLHAQHVAATGRGEPLILDASHPLAQQAFSGQA